MKEKTGVFDPWRQASCEVITALMQLKRYQTPGGPAAEGLARSPRLKSFFRPDS